MNLHDYLDLSHMQLTLLHYLDSALLSQLQVPPADQGLFGGSPLAVGGQREGALAGQGLGEGSMAWGPSSLGSAQACAAHTIHMHAMQHTDHCIHVHMCAATEWRLLPRPLCSLAGPNCSCNRIA